MFYWDGPLWTIEQQIERQRRDLRSQLLALECMTDLIPLLNKLSEIGDYSLCLKRNFEELDKAVRKFISDYWDEDETREIITCLESYRRKKTIPLKQEYKLCSKRELDHLEKEDR